MSNPTVELNNGLRIPLIGLGTWQASEDKVSSAVAYAINDAGYRHLDCAWIYRNEKPIGQGIRASGVTRSELFITSKLWCTHHSCVEQALDKTLANLGTDYLDLYLVHWPIALNPNGNDPYIPTLPNGKRDILYNWDLKETWRQMEAVYKKGKVKAIGVSNFSEKKLEQILPTAEIIPAVNQLEIHLYNPEHKLLAYLRSHNIQPQAHTPLGSTGAPLLADETVVELGRKYNLSPADILLGWLVAKNIVVLPKSVNNDRIASNMKGTLIAAKTLSAADIERLDSVAVSGKQKRFNMPPWPEAVDLGLENWTYPA